MKIKGVINISNKTFNITINSEEFEFISKGIKTFIISRTKYKKKDLLKLKCNETDEIMYKKVGYVENADLSGNLHCISILNEDYNFDLKLEVGQSIKVDSQITIYDAKITAIAGNFIYIDLFSNIRFYKDSLLEVEPKGIPMKIII